MNESEDNIADICDIFNIQCGEVFLTMHGNILFHCTLCENKYQGFQKYADHLRTEHSPLITIERYSTQSDQEEQSYVDFSTPCSDDDCAMATTDYSQNVLGENEKEINQIIPDNPHSLNTDIDILDKNVVSKKRTKRSSRPVRIRSSPKSKGGRFKCVECKFACKEYKNLVGHMKRHSDYRPHRCNECSKAFYTRFELNTHIRTHTGERPFLCPECGRGFITAGKLGDHSKRHQNKRDKQCNICEMRFFSAQSLQRHLTIHTSERFHKCDCCEASFKRRGALQSHRKIHENKREYQCELCPARFNQKPGLISHMKTRHLLAKSTSILR